MPKSDKYMYTCKPAQFEFFDKDINLNYSILEKNFHQKPLIANKKSGTYFKQMFKCFQWNRKTEREHQTSNQTRTSFTSKDFGYHDRRKQQTEKAE